ncbi:hypothetical protein GNF35_09900 [Clostridium perfringens]|nr:hypothetical protein [Clostridium perfringens]MDZ4996120.1 hypothetical protein [Clostridium perfringens]MDZ5030438.1 hypothetical protein [Clostridium perfringens]MDZ5054737.1 hypothetical protein [Clostridium perfringens]MDZ5065643.1 hypothetical protein [Clostridium perfringens]
METISNSRNIEGFSRKNLEGVKEKSVEGLKYQCNFIRENSLAELKDLNKSIEKANQNEASEIDNSPIKNKIEGCRREGEVLDELKDLYPEEEGYKVEQEVYLRDENGKVVKDPETGEARRIDFVVTKDGKVVKSIEVTSKTASKEVQTAKENRIRESGGNYIKDSNGNLVEIPKNIKTEIWRRE